MKTKIRERREELNLSQEDLAQRVGLTRVTICNIENDTYADFKVSNLKKIARALNCTLAYLLCEESQVD